MHHQEAVYSFSIATETWNMLHNLPRRREWHGSVAMENGIYIVGGSVGLYDNVEKFDQATRTFKTVGFLGYYPVEIGICQYDKDNFIFSGGVDNAFPFKTTYLYDTNQNILKQVGNLTFARNRHVMVKSQDGDIFAIGGEDLSDWFNSIEKFDRSTKTWSVIDARLEKARTFHQAVAYKNFIFIFGGRLQNKKVTDSIEKFDTITGEIQIIETKLLVARTGFAVARLGNLVYIMGGDIGRSNYTNSVEIFNLELETIEKGTSLPYADVNFTAHIF